MRNVKIISDGYRGGSKVIVDGKEMGGIQRVEYVMDVDYRMYEAIIYVLPEYVEINSENIAIKPMSKQEIMDKRLTVGEEEGDSILRPNPEGDK